MKKFHIASCCAALTLAPAVSFAQQTPGAAQAQGVAQTQEDEESERALSRVARPSAPLVGGLGTGAVVGAVVLAALVAAAGGGGGGSTPDTQ